MSTDTLQLTRVFKASRERVFDALTQSAAMLHWFGPRGCSCPSVTVDLRVGGRYRVEMHREDSGDVMVLTGEYREIVPPERLVFTWTWAQGDMAGVETVVSVTLKSMPGGTELSLTHSGLPTPKATQMHEMGWGSTWECLDDFLAGKGKAPIARPTLLGDPRSTFTRSARMALEEKGIAYTLEPHAPRDDAIGAIHPFHRIPAYRQGDFRLYETSAIARYVDETFPGPKLAPESPRDRARMEQWISAINCYLYNAMVRRYVLQYAIPRGAGGKPDRAVIDAALPEIDRQLGVLEAAYDGGDFLAGNALSLADLLLAPIVFYLQRFPESKALLAKYPNVTRAHGLIAQRPSFAATMPPVN